MDRQPPAYAECCCGAEKVSFLRRFATREEQLDWMNDYLKELEAEAKAVREHIADLENTE